MRFINATGSVWVALLAGLSFGCDPGVDGVGASGVGGGDATGGAGGTIASNNGAGTPGGSTAQFNPSGGGTPTPGCDSAPGDDNDMYTR